MRSPVGAVTASDLARAEKREFVQNMLLAAPAVGIIVVLLGLPVAWLFGLSFFDGGQVTTKHYDRILSDPVYLHAILVTIKLTVIVVGLCILLGYPLSYMLTRIPSVVANLCLALVLIPFWTSLLVRTYAWLVLLQRRGLVNSGLMAMGLTGQPIPLINNELGTVIGMFHIMLPFFVLPLYASMKRIDEDLLRAAAAMGASPIRTFWAVYLPLSFPGLIAGTVLVSVLCLGFYITPAILGGGKTLMIAMVIERNVNIFFEWGAASSVAVVFLVLVIAVFWILGRSLPLNRLFGVN